MNTVQTTVPAPAMRSMQWRSLEFILGALLTGVMLALVLLSVWIFPDRGSLMDLSARLTEPFAGWSHPLGTDPLGRDVLARVLVGGRISLMVGFLSVLGASALGIVIGLIAGYYRGFWDMLLMRCVDVQLALPFILVALTFISILGGGLGNIILFMMVSQWVQYARLVRGMVLSVREREFVQAARAFGVRDLAMIRHHILPNVLGPVLVLATIQVATAIIIEATLSFLGVGAPPTSPSLGTLIRVGNNYLFSGEWWITVFPGLMLVLISLSVNLLGDWLRDALNPKLR